MKMLPVSFRKKQTNFNNRQKQSSTTTPSISKTPNKNDSAESSKDKDLCWKQESDN